MKIIIFIDDECLFCNKFAIFCLKYEQSKKGAFYFVGLNSDISQSLFRKLNFSHDYKTVVCFKNGKIFIKSDAIIEVAKNLKLPFFLIVIIKILPYFLRNILYDLFSKNRYFFGKGKSCQLIPSQFKSRFIETVQDDF